MNETDVAHLAGVFDAVGTVTVNISKSDSYAIGYRYRPLLRIQRSTNEEDDPLMGKLLAYCDDTAVHCTINEEPHSTGTGSSTILTVDDPEDIERFLAPLFSHLVTKFKPAVVMMDDILPEVREGDHRTKQGFYELLEPADELRSYNEKGQNAKYTQEHFAAKWADDITV